MLPLFHESSAYFFGFESSCSFSNNPVSVLTIINKSSNYFSIQAS